jgi:hypothetical protein
MAGQNGRFLGVVFGFSISNKLICIGKRILTYHRKTNHVIGSNNFFQNGWVWLNPKMSPK